MKQGTRVVGAATITGSERDPRLSPAVLRFVAQAREFLAFVDTAPKLPLEDLLRQTRLHLLALYQAGAQLPEVARADREGKSRPRRRRRRVLSDMPDFGPWRRYWEVFDPYKNEEPLCGGLADDVCDVCIDLQSGFAEWDANPPRFADAVYLWRLYLNIHWGDHAVDAIRALQRACANVNEDR